MERDVAVEKKASPTGTNKFFRVSAISFPWAALERFWYHRYPSFRNERPKPPAFSAFWESLCDKMWSKAQLFTPLYPILTDLGLLCPWLVLATGTAVNPTHVEA